MTTDDGDGRRLFDEVLAGCLDLPTLTEADVPAPLGEWDSLTQLRVVLALEARFNIQLPARLLTDRAVTVGELRKAVLGP